jgi:quinol monooxygenase YgiN
LLPVRASIFNLDDDQWQAAYDKVGEHVFANEPNTLTYYFGIPLEHAANPSRTDNMLAFEAYRSRSDLYDIHLKSEPMLNGFLPAAMPIMTTGLDLTHFGAVGGYLDISGDRTECGIIHDVQIRCGGAAQRAELVGALKLLCKMVEQGEQGKRKEADILTFLGLVSEDDEVTARIYARYKSRDIWEGKLRGDLYKTFWEAVKPCVASMEAKGYAPNGKGWLWK